MTNSKSSTVTLQTNLYTLRLLESIGINFNISFRLQLEQISSPRFASHPIYQICAKNLVAVFNIILLQQTLPISDKGSFLFADRIASPTSVSTSPWLWIASYNKSLLTSLTELFTLYQQRSPPSHCHHLTAYIQQ